MSQFTPITVAQMREVLRPSNGWVEVEPSVSTKELVFDWPIKEVGQPLRVYSSILAATGLTRPVGADAIRVCVPTLRKSVSVYRVEGWRANLVEACRTMIEDVRVQAAKKAEAVAALPTFPCLQIFELLIRSAGKLKSPRISFQGATPVQFKLAGPHSKHAGQVIVTDGGPFGMSQWYGTITKLGVWNRSGKVTPEVEAVVQAFAADPVGYAAAYGKKSGRCCFCGKTLETPESLAVGYGPVCAEHHHLPWGKVEVA